MEDWRKDSKFKKDNEYENENFELDFEDEEDEDAISIEKENVLLRELDPDLIEYFNDAHLIRRKSPNGKRKRDKKDKVAFESGEIVKIKNETCAILYGPYEQDGKVFYEIETSKGNVETVEDKNIQKI